MTDLTQYRVDRSDSAVVVPVGMNSVRYVGKSWREARKAYERIAPGFDVWDRPNKRFGVILSVWDQTKQRYVVKCSKGFV
jgi:hypothetical protein